MKVDGPSFPLPPSLARPAAPASRAEAPPRAAAEEAAPAAAPRAEATLWDVLTPEERAFFAQQASLGPLSYGPRRGADASLAPLGQRVDVRA